VIDGVSVRQLRVITDERGAILHMLKRTDPEFQEFGEIYFSIVYQGMIKAWHIHSKMTLNYAVPVGAIKMVLYDDRAGSPTRGDFNEFYPGERNHFLISVPPGVWNGFRGVGAPFSLVANCATHVHDPEEISRLDPFSATIPYDWSLKHG
jgi:dTDP-4-dehydrorhamnose 3,5-epimerase